MELSRQPRSIKEMNVERDAWRDDVGENETIKKLTGIRKAGTTV